MIAEENILSDGDSGFVGVNNRMHPAQLPAGYVAHALNRTFDRGTIRNRPVVVRPQWGGISGQQEITMTTEEESVTVSAVVARAPMALASIHGDGIRPGTMVASYSEEQTVTIDREDISIDREDITIDSGSVLTLTRPPMAAYSAAAGYIAGNAEPFAGPIVGCTRFLDPETGGDVILVCVDVTRADGGRGRIWALQPGYVPQEVSLNGHDIAGRVRMFQCWNGVMLLRQGKARWYFKGDAVGASGILLAVTPTFPPGTRMTWMHDEGATAMAGLVSGANYYARIVSGRIRLHPSRADAIAGTNEIALSAGSETSRYYLERNDPSDALDNPDRNNGTPLICRPTLSQREPLQNGFDEVPTQAEVTTADPTTDILTIENHNLLPGDTLEVLTSTVGGVTAGTYYASVLDPHRIQLFAQALEALAGTGASLVDITANGVAVVRKAGTAAAPIPPAREGMQFGNRVWLVYGRDLLVPSNVGDAIHYQRITSELRANAGTDDSVVTVAPFNQTTLVIFKQRSVLALLNVYGDLGSVQLVEITREFGCVAADSVVNTGSDLIWLSQRGVASLTQTTQGITQSVVTPLSDEIQDYVRDISWSNVAGACAAYFGNRYLLSVPTVEDPDSNSVTLAFNFLNKAWEGVWNGPMLKPDRYVHTSVSGEPTLAFVDRSTFLHYFSPGLMDLACDGTQLPIETQVVTRGYRSGDMAHKRFCRVDAEIATLAPSYSFDAVWDGVNESQPLIAAQTPARHRYLNVNGGYYDPANSGDDFHEPYREDYSVPVGVRTGVNGISVGLHQRYLHKLRVGARSGSAMQLQLNSSTGSVELVAVRVEAYSRGTAGHLNN